MSIIDITREIHPEMAIYPNNPKIEFEQVQKATPLRPSGYAGLADHKSARNALTKVVLGTHTGTHIDTPAHINPEGAGALTYSLEQLNGPCDVVDLSNLEEVITAADIPKCKTDIIIIKTKNSLGDVNNFDDGFVALDDSAAEYLVKQGVKLVGLDALSIRKRGTKNQVHETLINNNIVILEGLWLDQVEAGDYELMCLPIKWDLDGAPARTVLKPRKASPRGK